MPQLTAMRILLFRTDRLGDVVISSTMVEATRRAYPEATVFFCAKQAYGPLLFAPDEAQTFLPWEAQTAQSLAAGSFDLSIHLHPDPACAQLAAEAGIPQRVGYANDAQWLTQTIPYNKDAGLIHERDYCLELVQAALPEVREAGQPKLPLTPWSIFRAEPTIVIHCGSFGAKAKLPPALLARLAKAAIDSGQLPQSAPAKVALIGTPEERHIADDTAAALRQLAIPVENLAGDLPLPGLAEFISRAALFIGRDSGPAHIAAATGCPTFCIFPVTRSDVFPARWHPLGEHVQVFEVPAKPWPWQKNAAAAEKAFAKLDANTVGAALAEFLDGTYR